MYNFISSPPGLLEPSKGHIPQPSQKAIFLFETVNTFTAKATTVDLIIHG
jgi:hypothetical protein